MSKANLHVVPHEGKWAVRAEGSEKVASVHKTQEEAIHHARETAHRSGVALIIHEQHGRIEHRESVAAEHVATKKANADQHVVAYQEKWAVKAAGSDKPTSVHDTQREAVERAREAAKKQGTVLFVHALDGHVREQHDYGK